MEVKAVWRAYARQDSRSHGAKTAPLDDKRMGWCGRWFWGSRLAKQVQRVL